MSEAYMVALSERHSRLELEIAEEEKRPHPDETKLHRLKKEKLRLKDELVSHQPVLQAS